MKRNITFLILIAFAAGLMLLPACAAMQPKRQTTEVEYQPEYPPMCSPFKQANRNNIWSKMEQLVRSCALDQDCKSGGDLGMKSLMTTCVSLSQDLHLTGNADRYIAYVTDPKRLKQPPIAKLMDNDAWQNYLKVADIQKIYQLHFGDRNKVKHIELAAQRYFEARKVLIEAMGYSASGDGGGGLDGDGGELF